MLINASLKIKFDKVWNTESAFFPQAFGVILWCMIVSKHQWSDRVWLLITCCSLSITLDKEWAFNLCIPFVLDTLQNNCFLFEQLFKMNKNGVQYIFWICSFVSEFLFCANVIHSTFVLCKCGMSWPKLWIQKSNKEIT